MNIWLMTVGEPLPIGQRRDSIRLYRTGMLARILNERGHRVTWWTSTVDHQGKTLFKEHPGKEPLDHNFELYFLQGCFYKKNISFQRLLNHYQIGRAFRHQSKKEEKPDLIVCSLPTLELCYEAARFAADQGIPFVIDVRDLWPELFYDVFPKSLQFMAKILFSPYEYMARFSLSRATSICGVSDGYLSWGLQKAGRDRTPQDLVVPLGYPNLKNQRFTSQTRHQLERMGINFDRPIVWFVGSFVKSIDLEPIIKVASAMQATHADVQFVFSGQGEDEAHYKDLARNLPNILWTGWLSQDEIAFMGSKALVGLAAYRIGAMQSLPNKFFEYMSFGLPILSSLKGEAQQLLREQKTGLTYQAGNAEDCLMRLKEILDNPFLQKMFSKNAEALFDAHYNAEAVYDHYANCLESFQNKAAKAG